MVAESYDGTKFFSLFLAHFAEAVFAAITSASMVKLRLEPSTNPLSDDRQSESSNFKDHDDDDDVVVVAVSVVVMLLKRWPLKEDQPSSSGKGSRPTDIRALLCRRKAMVLLGLLLILVVLDDDDGLCSGCFRVVVMF